MEDIMKLLAFLSSDLAVLKSVREVYNRNTGRNQYDVESRHQHTISYWRDRIMNKGFVENFLDENLTEKELLTLIEIGKQIAHIDAFNDRVNSSYLRIYMEIVESLHSARFDRRLAYLRSEPQLLLGAKAELRKKKSAEPEKPQ
jgi:hypothetical protein